METHKYWVAQWGFPCPHFCIYVCSIKGFSEQSSDRILERIVTDIRNAVRDVDGRYITAIIQCICANLKIPFKMIKK